MNKGLFADVKRYPPSLDPKDLEREAIRVFGDRRSKGSDQTQALLDQRDLELYHHHGRKAFLGTGEYFGSLNHD